MNESPTWWLPRFWRILQWLLAFLFGSFILLVICINVGLEIACGIYKAAFHLVLGFGFVPFRSFSGSITGVRFWGELAALLLLAILSSWALRKWWIRRHACPWTIRQGLALTLLLLLLFAASFVVGGGFRQARVLSQAQWTTTNYATHQASVQMMMGELRSEFWTIAREGKRFPDSLTAAASEWERPLLRPDQVFLHSDAELPPEPPIYLAGGLPVTLEPSFPLVISPCYRGEGSVWKRTVITLDGHLHEIDDSETETWIQRAIDMRRAHASP